MSNYIIHSDPIGNGEYQYTLVGELVRCKECIYYDAPHVEKGGKRYEYADMPEDAFDKFGIGVHSGYGVNVGGRCLRSKSRLARGKSIFMEEDDYCSKGERRADDDEK